MVLTFCFAIGPIPSSPALSSTYSIIYTPSSTPANSECGGITLEDLSDSEGTVLVSKYWDKYPGYHQDPSAPLADAFNGLTLHMGWSPKSKKQRRRRGECYQEEFGTHFGTVADKLETWQALCGEVGIEPIPKSITQCKKVSSHSSFSLFFFCIELFVFPFAFCDQLVLCRLSKVS